MLQQHRGRRPAPDWDALADREVVGYRHLVELVRLFEAHAPDDPLFTGVVKPEAQSQRTVIADLIHQLEAAQKRAPSAARAAHLETLSALLADPAP